MNFFKYFVLAIAGILLLVIFRPSITGYAVSEGGIEINENVELVENGSIEVIFCPSQECQDVFVDEFLNANETIFCAFFDLDDDKLIGILADKSKRVDVRLVLDSENVDEQLFGEGVVLEKSSSFMHNKFCVIDDSFVISGSANPTHNGFFKNDNNILIIKSKGIVSNYKDEFEELWNGDFSGGSLVNYDVIYLNVNDDEIKVESLFCPEDECEGKVLDVLEGANKSVRFMAFSFTSDPIEEKLISKFESGVEVKGVMEKRSKSKYAAFDGLNESEIDVRWDRNGNTMHHKVFIVDSKIVVTGSYNPTNRGNKINDENILIIYDEGIANLFLKEFERVYGDI